MSEPNAPGPSGERDADERSTDRGETDDRSTDGVDAGDRSTGGRDTDDRGTAHASTADGRASGPGTGDPAVGDTTGAAGADAAARTGERRTEPRIGYRQVGEVAWRSMLSLVVIGLLVAIILGMGFLVYEDRLAAEPLVLLVGLLAGYLLGRLETYF